MAEAAAAAVAAKLQCWLLQPFVSEKNNNKVDHVEEHISRMEQVYRIWLQTIWKSGLRFKADYLVLICVE